MSFNLTGKNILVTGGGGTGVGKGICEVLSGLGATILLNEKKSGDAEQAAKNYPGAISAGADITVEDEVEQMFSEIKNRVGVLHGLVNNAGIGLIKPAYKASSEEFDHVFSTDVKGLWHVSKLFANQLIENNLPGSIVNISSVHAHSTVPKYAIYASAKSAVEGLTRGLAVELGQYNIRVNAIGPGYVYSQQSMDLISTWAEDPMEWVKAHTSDQQVLNYEIQPEDCGYTAAFLLSELSRSVTGQTIYVDNGSTSLLYNRSFTE